LTTPRGGEESSAPRAVLWGLAGGSILIPLNSTMLAVAIPSIMDEFKVEASAAALLVSAYLAAVAIVIPISGGLGDRFGHRRMFLFGVTAFSLTSMLGAFAWTFPVLVGARILQGISGAVITPNSVSLVRTIAPESRRGSTFGMFDMLISVSAAAGPFVGGLFVNGLGWRSLFLLVLPIGGTAIVTVRKQLAESKIRMDNPPMDIAGLVLLAIFLGGLVVGLQRLGDGSAGRWQILVSLVSLGLFVVRESRAAHPALPLSLFKQKGFSAAIAGVFGATVILHATFFLVPIFIQNLLFGSALMTGLVLLGLSAVGGSVAPFSGRLSDRVGRRTPAVAGSLSMAAGMGLLSLFSESATLIVIAGCLCLVGIGFGMSGTPRQTSALESAHASRTGMAAGIYYSSRYIGGSIGATLAGVTLAEQANRAAMSRAFGMLFVTAVLVAAFSFRLPGAPLRQRIIDPA